VKKRKTAKQIWRKSLKNAQPILQNAMNQRSMGDRTKSNEAVKAVRILAVGIYMRRCSEIFQNGRG
jgi:type III secretory pathway component EscU